MNRHHVRIQCSLILVLSIASASAFAADAATGREVFRQQCAICHTAESDDNGGAQGPALTGLFGRAAATQNFSYTSALRNAKLTWDAATLDRFLASPTTVVPGSSMVVAVASQADRDNLIAYFDSVKNVVATSATPQQPRRDEAQWRKDAPGRVHRIELNKLPAPFDTPTVRNAPKLIERPAGAELSLPAGFKVEVFATKLQGPRRMIVAPNGDVLVTETRAGRISLLRRVAGATNNTVFIEGLKQPFGLAFYPQKNARWLYVAETHRIVRYAYKAGDQRVRSAAEVVVASLPNGSGHFTRDLVFSPDGERMYVSVGSATNVAEQLPKKSLDDIKVWEAEHGLGALWDLEANRAAVLVYDVGSDKPTTFATGLRNCVSVTIQPKTNDLWCTTNERDLLGDDLVPDYSTRVKQGGFYGWPWYYLGDNEDPRLQGDRPDLRGKVLMPDVLFQAHSAALHLTFYPGPSKGVSGKVAFPADYIGDAIVAFHGSWNRNFRTGYKLVRIRMKQGVPNGEYEDFLTGFIVDDGNVWGRPVATTVMQDGSLLVSDDGADQIYRVFYAR